MSIYENQIHDYEEQIALNEQTLHSLKEHLQDQNLKIESLNTMRTHLENEIQSLKHKKHIQENRAEEIAFKNSSLYAQFHDKKIGHRPRKTGKLFSIKSISFILRLLLH